MAVHGVLGMSDLEYALTDLGLVKVEDNVTKNLLSSQVFVPDKQTD